jgi:hypothetical protein
MLLQTSPIQATIADIDSPEEIQFRRDSLDEWNERNEIALANLETDRTAKAKAKLAKAKASDAVAKAKAKASDAKAKWTVKSALKLIGSLSKAGKMPCRGWSIPASLCKVGGKLRDIPGSVCHRCYAFERGNYRFKGVQRGLLKRLHLFLSAAPALWVSAMAFMIDRLNEGYFRWFDSGDLQSLEMIERIVAVAVACPDTKFWLPTKEYNIIGQFIDSGREFPSNLNVRLSAYMIDGPAPLQLAKLLGVTVSTVTSGEDFTCPSSRQGNKCLDCRACWNRNIADVRYLSH